MINGTSVILQNSEGDIVGQMEMTISFQGAVIDVTNKSFEEWITIFDGAVSSKQLQISGSIVYNDDSQYRKIRHDAFNGILDNYTVTYVSELDTEEIFSASMMPNALSDSFPHGDKITTSISFLSSGVVSTSPRILVKALITDLYPVLAIENTMTGIVEVDEIREYAVRVDVEVMAGITSVEEIVLVTFGAVEYTETEETMSGVTTVEDITLVTFGNIEYTETEETMMGVTTVEEIILETFGLIEYTETEETMAGITTVEEITLTKP